MNVSVGNLDQTARKTDPKYRGYTVSWTDNARGVGAGGMSVFGSNNTDQTLEAEDGGVIPFVRTDNFDEHLGVTDTDKIILTGEGDTLESVMMNLVSFTSYTGKTIKNVKTVKKCAIRFQNAFVGVREGSTRNIAPSNFSFQTRDEKNPRNLLLVATPMGLYVHVDGVGKKKLLVNELSADKTTLVNKWFEVEASEFAVGHDMPNAPRSDGAPASKKTKSVQLGVKGSGPRANRMVIVAIPLKQKQAATRGMSWVDEDDDGCVVVYRSLGGDDDGCGVVYRSMGGEPPVGKARAARMSVGHVFDEEDVDEMELEMDDSESVVVTQIDYNTISLPGDNPTVRVGDDAIEFACQDMNRQYDLCETQCKLSQLPAMLHKMTKEHMENIKATMKAVAEKNLAAATKTAKKAATENPFAPQANAHLAFA